MNKVYKNLEDVLPEGYHKIKVSPMPEFEDVIGEDGKPVLKDNGKPKKKPVEGTHKKGVSKTGNNWWMYSTKVGEEYISLFANAESKPWFDTGEVEANVCQKIDKASKRPIFDVVDGVPVKVMRFFINDASKAVKFEAQDPVEKLPQAPTAPPSPPVAPVDPAYEAVKKLAESDAAPSVDSPKEPKYDDLPF